MANPTTSGVYGEAAYGDAAYDWLIIPGEILAVSASLVPLLDIQDATRHLLTVTPIYNSMLTIQSSLDTSEE